MYDEKLHIPDRRYAGKTLLYIKLSTGALSEKPQPFVLPFSDCRLRYNVHKGASFIPRDRSDMLSRTQHLFYHSESYLITVC